MYQLCPKCGGGGKVAPEPNNQSTAVNTLPVTCPLCKGEFTIHQVSGLPPSKHNALKVTFGETAILPKDSSVQYGPEDNRTFDSKFLFVDQAIGEDSSATSFVRMINGQITIDPSYLTAPQFPTERIEKGQKPPTVDISQLKEKVKELINTYWAYNNNHLHRSSRQAKEYLLNAIDRI